MRGSNIPRVMLFLLLYGETSWALQVIVTKIRGQLHGEAKLKCTISPRGQTIRHIEWIKGTKKGSQKEDSIYFDSIDPLKRNHAGVRGTFKLRDVNVSGTFLGASAYELAWYHSVGSDEDTYTCSVRSKSEEEHRAQINFKLYANPSSPPAIEDDKEKILSSSGCDPQLIKEIKWFGKLSLFCIVRQARPRPKVNWYKSTKEMEIHGAQNQTKRKDGLDLFTVKQKLEVNLQKNTLLRCSVDIPNSEGTRLKRLDVCLRVTLYEPPKSFKFTWVLMLAILFVLVLFAFTWFITQDLPGFKDPKKMIILQATWNFTLFLLFLNIVSILHISYDDEYRKHLITMFKNPSDTEEPYILYHRGWLYFAMAVFALRTLFDVISFLALLVHRTCLKRGRKRKEKHPKKAGPDTVQPKELGITDEDQPDTPDGETKGSSSIVKLCFGSDKKRVCRTMIPILLGPSIVFLYDACTIKDAAKKLLTGTKKAMLVDIPLQLAFLAVCAILYAKSQKIELSPDSGRSCMKSTRETTIALFVLVAVAVVVYSFVILFFEKINKHMSSKGTGGDPEPQEGKPMLGLTNEAQEGNKDRTDEDNNTDCVDQSVDKTDISTTSCPTHTEL